MNKIKLVLTDIDGTLLDLNHQTTPKTKSIVKSLSEQGVEVVMASARAPKAMDFLAAELELQTCLVCFNGALITQKVRGEFVDSYSLTLGKTEALYLYQKISTDFPAVSFNLYSRDQWLVGKEGYWEKQEAAIAQIEPQVVSLKAYLQKSRPSHKILCMGEEKDIDRLQDQVNELGMETIAVNKSKATYLEIVNAQVSKLGALQVLLEQRGLSASEAVAIGDNYNDLPMIQAAGCGLAMGNAPQPVQQSADFVVPTNADDGFYYGMKKIFG